MANSEITSKVVEILSQRFMSFNIYHEHQNAIFFQFTNKLIMYWGQEDDTWACDLFDSTDDFEDGQWRGSIYTNVPCTDEPTAAQIADAITERVNQYQRSRQMYDFLTTALTDGEFNLSEKSRSLIDQTLDEIDCGFFQKKPDSTYQEDLRKQRFRFENRQYLHRPQPAPPLAKEIFETLRHGSPFGSLQKPPNWK